MDANRYYLNRHTGVTGQVIKSALMTDKDAVVHGAQAINAQLPPHLRKHTSDWDIFDTEARAMAHKIERALDNRYGGNYFVVKLGKHKGTFKVVSKVSGETVADVTAATDIIPYRVIGSIRYATLDYHVKRIKAILADKTASYRHEKDKETARRIRLARGQ